MPATITRLTDYDLDGYQAGAPSQVVAEMDRPIAERGACGNCGRAALSYRPFTKRGEVFSYRAFVECRACGSAAEF